jgi:hypothetical protein
MPKDDATLSAASAVYGIVEIRGEHENNLEA